MRKLLIAILFVIFFILAVYIEYSKETIFRKIWNFLTFKDIPSEKDVVSSSRSSLSFPGASINTSSSFQKFLISESPCKREPMTTHMRPQPTTTPRTVTPSRESTVEMETNQPEFRERGKARAMYMNTKFFS